MVEQYTPPGAENWKAPGPSPEATDYRKPKEEREREIVFSKGWERYYPPTSDAQGRALVPDTIRTYNTNNSLVAAVDSGGNKFVRPLGRDDVRKLEDVGFVRDGKMGVPYSHEGPTHPDALKRWQALWDTHRREEADEAKAA